MTLNKLKIYKEIYDMFNNYQMEQIRLGLYLGLDVSKYANPSLGWEEMDKIRERLLAEKRKKEDD